MHNVLSSNHFRYYENSPESFDYDTVSVSLAGLGIGLLATAAVSLAPTLSDLALTGAQVVRQAFRLGVLVDEVSQNLQPRDWIDTSTPDTWAYVLPDVTAEDVQQELDAIHEKEVSTTHQICQFPGFNEGYSILPRPVRCSSAHLVLHP